jgi:hypothetical protein
VEKPKTHAVLRQDTNWKDHKLRQYWDKTQNGQTRGSIEKRQRMDKPDTQRVLKKDAEWTNQRNRQH